MDTFARRRLDSAALIAGAVVNGAAVYAVSIIGIRAYGAADFAPISVLWTFWAVLSAVLTFPVQHWVIHRMAADGSDATVAAALPRVVAVGIVFAGVLGAVAWLGGEQFFGVRNLAWPVLVGVLAIGTAVAGVVRGVLAGRRRYRAVVAVIASENVVRLVACTAVVAADGSIEVFGVAFASSTLCLAAWPGAFRFASPGAASQASLARFIGGLGAGAILAQVVLNAGPIVLSAIGGSPEEVTSLFVTMALFRAPYIVALGLSVQLTGPATRMAMGDNPAALRRSIRRTAFATMCLGGLAVPFGLTAGKSIVELVYGSSSTPDAGVVALVAAGSVLALGSLAIGLMLAARAATNRVAAAWTLAVLAAAIVIAISPTRPIVSVAARILDCATRSTDRAHAQCRLTRSAEAAPVDRRRSIPSCVLWHPAQVASFFTANTSRRPRGEEHRRPEGEIEPSEALLVHPAECCQHAILPTRDGAKPAAAGEPADGKERKRRGECVGRPLNIEACVSYRLDETSTRVSAMVAGADVKLAPGPLIRGDRSEQAPARLQDPTELTEKDAVVRNVLDDVKCREAVE